MKSTIGLQLIEIKWDAKEERHVPKDIVSRGGAINLYGYDCQYIGVTPDKVAHFWLGPGNVQSLNEEQLLSQSYKLIDFYDREKQANGRR